MTHFEKAEWNTTNWDDSTARRASWSIFNIREFAKWLLVELHQDEESVMGQEISALFERFALERCDEFFMHDDYRFVVIRVGKQEFDRGVPTWLRLYCDEYKINDVYDVVRILDYMMVDDDFI